MNENRIQPLNEAAVDSNGKYVLYWMQQSQRAHANPALEHAVRLANENESLFAFWSNITRRNSA